MTPPDDLGELVRALPDARLHILERSGHGVSLEQPAQAKAQIEPFLAASASDARPAQRGRR